MEGVDGDGTLSHLGMDGAITLAHLPERNRQGQDSLQQDYTQQTLHRVADTTVARSVRL